MPAGTTPDGYAYPAGYMYVNKFSGLAAWGYSITSMLGDVDPWPKTFQAGYGGDLAIPQYESSNFTIIKTCIWTKGSDDNGFAALRPATDGGYNMNVVDGDMVSGTKVITYPWTGDKDNMR
jgi:hypothetical protein